MPNATTQETLQKLTGNVSEELGEAGYRLAADQLVDAIRNRLLNSAQLREKIAPGMTKEFEANMRTFLQSEAGEAVISFVLAVALELLPTDVGHDVRRTLAANLRIQAYQELGEFFLQVAGLIDKDIKDATKLITGKSYSPLAEATADVVSKQG